MHSIKEIRQKLGYSIRGFAILLGIKPATYQCYDEGRRMTPTSVLKSAEEAYRRDRAFFRQLPRRVDENQKTAVPNEAIKGAWA